MKHASSNTNVLKKTHTNGGNHKKTNIFKKFNGNQNYIKSNNMTGGKKKYLIYLLDKSTPKNNTNKFNFNTKKNKSKEIYLTSGFENLNIEDGYKTRPHHGNINIRLNLNSEIINNNFNNCYTSTKQKNFHKSRSNINLNEKLKEKDKLIIKLQKELLQSQELLNKIQKDKQNELSMTFNTIKKINNLDKNNNRSLTALLSTPSLLKFNYNNNKMRESIKKNSFNVFNSGLYSNNNRKYKISSSSPKSNYIRCFSSSPHRFFTYNLDNLESYNSNFSGKNSLYQKSNKSIKINQSSNSNIFMKRNEKYSSPEQLYFTRQISNSNYNNYNKNNYMSNSELIDKCQKLKKRAKLLLNNYISLIKEQNIRIKNKNNKINKNK